MVLPLLIVIASNLVSPSLLPKIIIKSWTTNDELNFDSISPLPVTYQNQGNTIIGIPSSVGGITLFCNATYPIEWDFHHHQLGSFGAPIRGQKRSIAIISTTRQTNDNINNSSSFVYESELKILGGNNIMTGNYTCQGIDSPDISNSIYIYWEGSSPPFLTLASMNISVNWDLQSRQVVLPCKVSRPDIQVDLYQITHNDTVPIHTNESINYDPTRGFLLSNLEVPYGQYKCVANGEPGKDYLLVHVLPDDNLPYQEQPTYKLLRPASLTFDGDKSQFVCCSRKDKPPAMAHFYCEHPITCELRKDSLIDFENSGVRLPNSNTCAAIKVFAVSSGVFRCVGDGIDITQSYIFPIDTPSPWEKMQKKEKENKTIIINPPYYNWNEIKTDKMLEIKTSSQNGIYFATRNYTFSCKYSTAYFSHGVRWVLHWKNQSTILIDEAVVNETSRRGYRQIFRNNVASVIITVDMQLDFVNCFAPVWNSSEWKNKSLSFAVQAPEIPKITGENSLEEVFEWYLNDTNKELTCNFTGKPNPFVTWKKDNKTLVNNYNISLTNGSSTLKISRVSYETHGDFICTVMNFKGNATKIFRIIVLEQSSTGFGGVLTAFVIIGFILVLFGSGLLAWKLYTQKRIINHLAEAAFKDVHSNSRQEHVPTINTINTSLAAAAAVENGNGQINHGFGFGNDLSNSNGHTSTTTNNEDYNYSKGDNKLLDEGRYHKL